MKKIYLFALSTIAIVASFVACTKEITVSEESETPSEIKEVELSINAAGVNTKTYIDGTDVKWASTGEYLYVYELATPTEGDVVTTHKKSSQGTTTDSGATMNFVTSLAEKATGYTNFDYYAFYPADSRQSGTYDSVNIETTGSQTPTASSFDPKADLLIASPITGQGSQAASLDMQFARAVAVGKITISNLPSDEEVTEVRFSAIDDGDAVVLAGRTSFNLGTATPVSSYGNNKEEDLIVLDYSALSLTADSSMDVFFTCYPFDLAAGDSFTLVVKTETYTYTRTVSLTGSQAISFKAGKASRFSVNMSTASETVNAQDIPYAILTYDAAVSAGLAANYATGSTTDIVGGKWEWNAYKGTGIQLKNKTATSYIKTPVFKENIRKVVINLSAEYSGKYLRFDSVSSSYEGDIYSLTLTSDTEYEIDFESESISVNTFYLHAVDAAVNIESIEVYAGDDNSVQLTTPTGVTAALTDDGAGGTVANSITVSWTAVDHADYYVVTLTPTSGDPVSSKVETVSATIGGLIYDTTYSVGVVAYANNKGLYSASNAGTCSNITTDSAPGIAVDDVLFEETWGSYSGGVDRYTFTGTTIYSGDTSTLDYTSSHSSSVVNNGTAGVITSNNFFFYKSAESGLTIAGIPLEGATELTLTYKTNGTNIDVYYTIDDGEEQKLKTGCTKGANEDTISGISNTATSITLRFYKTGTNANNRIDDIQLVVASLD